MSVVTNPNWLIMSFHFWIHFYCFLSTFGYIMALNLFQNELLVASEAAKTSQRSDLENHIKTAQVAMEEKTAEVEKLKQSLEKVILRA